MAWPQDAYVGQKVVCVDVRTRHPTANLGWNKLCDVPIEGHEYTVREIGIKQDGHVGVKLNEITWRGKIFGVFIEDGFYWIMRFRPIQTKSTETGMAILRKLQDPVNHKVLEGV